MLNGWTKRSYKEMALFKNREKRTIAQLEDYYASRHSTGKAWAMAFLSLLITVAVLSAIFFGGRWLYRTLTDDDAKKSEDSSQVEGSEIPGVNADIDEDQSGLEIVSTDSDTETVVVADGDTDANVEIEGSVGGTVTEEAASTSVPNVQVAERQAAEDQQGIVAGEQSDSSSDSEGIPDTGAGEVLLIAPLVAVIAGYLFSLRRQAVKVNVK